MGSRGLDKMLLHCPLSLGTLAQHDFSTGNMTVVIHGQNVFYFQLDFKPFYLNFTLSHKKCRYYLYTRYYLDICIKLLKFESSYTM